MVVPNHGVPEVPSSFMCPMEEDLRHGQRGGLPLDVCCSTPDPLGWTPCESDVMLRQVAGKAAIPPPSHPSPELSRLFAAVCLWEAWSCLHNTALLFFACFSSACNQRLTQHSISSVHLRADQMLGIQCGASLHGHHLIITQNRKALNALLLPAPCILCHLWRPSNLQSTPVPWRSPSHNQAQPLPCM